MGTICDTVYALNTFKEAIYEDPHLVLSNWNALDSAPCGWAGIFCSMAQDHVIKMLVIVFNFYVLCIDRLFD